jgi:radical SAM-linked protein
MKLRIRFSKLGKVRFTSHRDVARIWERALRRAELPVAYSGGFSPRPKLSFGLALPTGAESIAEYLDVDLDEERSGPVESASLPARLTEALPAGLEALAAGMVERGTPSLQEAVNTCSWVLHVQGVDEATMHTFVDRTLAADDLVVTRERKGKQVTDDLRPAIRSLAVVDSTYDGVELEAELGVHPRSLRPAELIDAIAAGLVLFRVRRTHQWIERDDAREEPLALPGRAPATSAPHAEVRAS